MKKLTLSLLTVALLSACNGNPNMTTALAGLGGAAVGGVIGHQFNDDNGRYVGAAAGALAGAAIGHYMNQQQQQLAQQVSDAGVQVNRVDEATIQLNIQSEILFDFDRAEIKPAMYPTLDRIAQVLMQYPNTVVHIYGFTDASGNEIYNENLSEQRAWAAANYLMARGITQDRLLPFGRGERYARGARNPADRRVEIYIRAVDANNPNAAYQPVIR